jgi:hypothetical protein
MHSNPGSNQVYFDFFLLNGVDQEFDVLRKKNEIFAPTNISSYHVKNRIL